jgi:predicted transcriptional regulator
VLEKKDGISRLRLRQPHRDYYEIIKVILQNVYSRMGGGGCKPFELAYRCELTWNQFRDYRDLLISRRLLIPSNSETNHRYEITPKGERYLQLFTEIEDDLRPS